MKHNLILNHSDFSFFADMMHRKSGVFLPDNEKNHLLVRQRLLKLVEKYDLKDFTDLKQRLARSSNLNIETDFVCALTTNKTEFFREMVHFDFLKQAFKQELAQNSKIRVWCAAGSTGQESYSIAMLLKELSNGKNDIKILSTDIDQDALSAAAAGCYSKREMFGLNKFRTEQYFNLRDDQYRIKSEISNLVHFAPFNLLSTDYPFVSAFDFVFCRNVLIYFDPPTINHVCSRLHRVLKPGGYLILGVSESGVLTVPGFEALGSSIFRKLQK